jgi:hypothetical protein
MAAPFLAGWIYAKAIFKFLWLQQTLPRWQSLGLFKFVHMSFGLHNAGMTFQRLIDSLPGRLPFTFIYLYDVLVASPNSSSVHRQHMATVFAILQQNSLVENAEKCLFGCTDIEFLVHRLIATGFSP